MRRVLFAALLVSVAVAVALAWAQVRREREYVALVRQGDDAVDRRDAPAAIELYSGAIALSPDPMIAWFRRGEVYRTRGDLPAALRDLREATRRDPSALVAIERLGDVYFALERYDRAAERYDACLALDDTSAAVFYKLGLARFYDGQLDRAVSALTRAVAMRPVFAEAHYLLGICLTERGGTADAAAGAAALQRAVELAPAMLAAREELAALEDRRGRKAARVRQLEALAALDPERPERHATLARAYLDLGRPDLAAVTLVRANERLPDQPRLLLELGRVWLAEAERSGERVNLSKALAALGQAAERQPSSEALALLGRAHLRAGDTRRALAVLQQAASRYPIDPLALPSLAAAAERLGRVELARTALVREAALVGDQGDPRDVARRFEAIAALCSRLGDEAAARHWLDRALDVEPANARVVTRLVTLQRAAGENDAADATLARALVASPEDPALLALKRR